MTANVYFRRIDSSSSSEETSKAGADLLRTIIEKENVILQSPTPLKVHFGEKGNTTFIRPDNFEGIIGILKEKNIDTSFIETNVLYRGARTKKDDHIALAKAHGFTSLPIIIADGDHGENQQLVTIDKKHFRSCKIGNEFSHYKSIIVLSHFKGHILAGFGGALKQLAMGCASRGGKLDQHVGAQPFINPFTCKKCKTCVRHCPVNAICIDLFPRISKRKCIGCASCIAICPYNSIKINWLKSLSPAFAEKIAEYAFAAQKDKTIVYISFAQNITDNCDCEAKNCKIVSPDIGVLASTDPVAIDQACLDLVDKAVGKKLFRGRKALAYAEKIGLGNRKYFLVEI